MSTSVYQEMFEVMTQRGGLYTGADIPEFYAVVEELFTPEEAAANNAMPKGLFSASQLAEIMGRSEDEISPLIEAMADKALCFFRKNRRPAPIRRLPIRPRHFRVPVHARHVHGKGQADRPGHSRV